MHRLVRALIPALLLPVLGCAWGERAASPRARGVEVGYDVEHYGIDVALDPVRRSIAGSCTLRLWASAALLERVDLDLADLTVSAVRDRAGRTLEFRQDGPGERLSVVLRQPLARGEYEELSIDYGGVPRRGLWFARVRDGVPTQAFTHGECSDARGWFPCHDLPADRATSEVRVTMPAAWTSIAAGERLERVEDGAHATERWRTTCPHPSYLETLVAGELVVQEDVWEGTPLFYAAAPDLARYLPQVFEETGAVLGFLSDVTGVRYPYPKYAQTCVDDFPFGGMENVSATTLTDTILPDAEGLEDANQRDLIAHEAAHQWFGDLVTCRDWSEIWLNEGFATYFAALYEEHASGRDAFERMLRDAREVHLSRDAGTARRPIVQATAGDPLAGFFTGHVYEGGAARLHYLRSLFGDEAFFAAIRAYLAAHRGASVTTADLREAFESVTGQDLRPLFRQWFEEAGHPRVSSRWSHADGAVALTLEQEPIESARSRATFDLVLDVEIRTSTDSRTERVHFSGRRQSYRLSCDGEPLWVLVDPHDAVPMELDERMSLGSWLAVARDGHVGARLRALAVLDRARVKELRPEDVAAVERELVRLGAEDESEFVRAAAVEALGRAHQAERRADVRELLVYAVRHDVQPAVVAAAWRALRAFGADAELHALALERLGAARGWNLRAAIVAAIASSDPDHAFEFLVEQLETRSVHGVFEAQVLARLLATGDPRARGVLLAWLADPTRPDAPRVAALHELARTRLLEPELEAVIDVLSSPRIRLRRAALAALGASKDSRARAALARHAATSPSAVERIAIDEVLDRTADGP